MGRAYSNDLRERVVKAVIKGGLSRHEAAAQFGVILSVPRPTSPFYIALINLIPPHLKVLAVSHRVNAIFGVNHDRHRSWVKIGEKCFDVRIR
jgi:hypothetical protein